MELDVDAELGQIVFHDPGCGDADRRAGAVQHRGSACEARRERRHRGSEIRTV